MAMSCDSAGHGLPQTQTKLQMAAGLLAHLHVPTSHWRHESPSSHVYSKPHTRAMAYRGHACSAWSASGPSAATASEVRGVVGRRIALLPRSGLPAPQDEQVTSSKLGYFFRLFSVR